MMSNHTKAQVDGQKALISDFEAICPHPIFLREVEESTFVCRGENIVSISLDDDVIGFLFSDGSTFRWLVEPGYDPQGVYDQVVNDWAE